MYRRKQRMKRITAAGAACMLLLSLSAPLAHADGNTQIFPISAEVQQASSVQVTTKTISEKTDVFEGVLHIPVISGLQDAAYQATLNANIARRAANELEALKKQAEADAASAEGVYEFRPYSMELDYKLIGDGSAKNGNVLSFKVMTWFYTGGAHGSTRVEAYNVRNEAKASAIKLKELFGAGYKSVINKAVQAEITAHEELYFPDAFKSIADNQPFYLKDGKAVIIFQEYEIAPYAVGLPEIAVALPSKTAPVPGKLASFSIIVNGTTLTGVKLYVGRDGIAMAPLRQVSAKLGYGLEWKDGQVGLHKGTQRITLQTGKDTYSADKESLSLGAAPVVKYNTLYVPLSFFSKVLKATVTYSKDSVLIQ
ncbi:stalk domain-containing protein [Paenibacillus montanisoli]|nr:DUF4163 domain-containing protein [Paenibacillus montanisoli]